MASASHAQSCDFAGSVSLAGTSPYGDGPYSDASAASYYFTCDESLAGTSVWMSCSVSDHCVRGQRLEVRVSASVRAYDSSTSDPLIHVTSLARIMKLLSFRVDSAGGKHLDRGYQTEALADKTLELVWCLEAHCPDSARDWDPDATHDSCLADVNNIAGFVSRKRPSPKFDVAHAYYTTALSHVPAHCPTLGYLAELYVMKSNATGAEQTAQTLCAACGPISPTAMQVAASFASGGMAWPSDGYCAFGPPSLPPKQPSSPPPPSPPPPRVPPFGPIGAGETVVSVPSTVVELGLTVAGTVESFGVESRTRLKASLRAVLNCQEPACFLALRVSAGSLSVTAILTIPEAPAGSGTSSNSAATAAAVEAAAIALVAKPSAAISADLGVTVTASTPVTRGRAAVPVVVAPPPPAPPPAPSDSVLHASLAPPSLLPVSPLTASSHANLADGNSTASTATGEREAMGEASVNVGAIVIAMSTALAAGTVLVFRMCKTRMGHKKVRVGVKEPAPSFPVASTEVNEVPRTADALGC